MTARRAIVRSPLDRMGYEIGAGLKIASAEGMDFSINYIGRFRDNYVDNTGWAFRRKPGKCAGWTGW